MGILHLTSCQHLPARCSEGRPVWLAERMNRLMDRHEIRLRSADWLYLVHSNWHMLEPKTYEAKVDDRLNIPLDVTDLEDLDLIREGESRWHLLHQGQSYHIEVEEARYADKIFILRVNGFRHEVRLADPYDVLIDKLGLAKKVVHAVNEVKAPMPGLIRELQVRVGDTVEEGQAVLILEAMKMENVIKSPAQGTVREILTDVGSPVEKGQVMVIFE